ncbi:MAG: XdhC family protein [Chloroflexi bacterium]|nr:MAG: XdhC family protein [Chloroflexota bacterium]
MSELSDILDAIDELAARGEPMALVTIVATRGSTYRQAGARMLVPATREPIGNISGGCLEDDVARIGREVIHSGLPRTVEFDMTADDDAVWGYGLGCNGSIDLFMEPTSGATQTAAAIRAAWRGDASVIADRDPVASVRGGGGSDAPRGNATPRGTRRGASISRALRASAPPHCLLGRPRCDSARSPGRRARMARGGRRRAACPADPGALSRRERLL